MNKKDDFDKFLEGSFQKAHSYIEDDGFTKNVISNLPVIRFFPVRRTVILFLTSIASVLVFFISNGYKTILLSMIDIFNKASLWIAPSGISILVIFVFIGVITYISYTEYNKSTI